MNETQVKIIKNTQEVAGDEPQVSYKIEVRQQNGYSHLEFVGAVSDLNDKAMLALKEELAKFSL